MTKLFHIYKLTNTINNKCYIGFTQDIKKRIVEHQSESKNNKSRLIYKAIQKYGFAIFHLETLYSGSDAEFALRVMEPKLIKEHNSHFIDGYGYNMTYGGDGILGYIHNDATKKIMKEKRALQVFSDETKQKMSNSSSGKKKTKNHNENIAKARTGTKRSKETKQKLRDAWIRRKEKGLPVNQYM